MTKIYLSLSTNFRFSVKVSGPTKTSKKDQSFYNTVLLKNPHSFYEPQLTQNHQSYTPATQLKHVSGLSQKKPFTMHHFSMPKNCILGALGMSV